eukprot:201235_1
MMESINSDAFGIYKNWSLRFVRSRIDNRKIIIYLKLLCMPNKISKIIVNCVLKNKMNNMINIRKNNKSFTYRNNKFYFFNQIIPETEQCDINPVELKIVIINVYDDKLKLINTNEWHKYGII